MCSVRGLLDSTNETATTSFKTSYKTKKFMHFYKTFESTFEVEKGCSVYVRSLVSEKYWIFPTVSSQIFRRA